MGWDGTGWERGTGGAESSVPGTDAQTPTSKADASRWGMMVSPSLSELRDVPAVPHAKFPLEKGRSQTQAGSVLQLDLIMPSKPLPGPPLPTIWEQS